MKVNSILVVGAGLMGRGIVQVAAECGYKVLWNDVSLEFINKGWNVVENNLNRKVKKGEISLYDKDKICSHITVVEKLTQEVEVDLVIEAITENIELKNDLYKQLDTVLGPETVFASNTSSISINTLSKGTKRPEKFIGVHFFNPVPVMPLVEIIRGLVTSDETYEAVKIVLETMGKVTILAPDYPAFLVNRILLPMMNESFFCVMEGAEPEDVDQGMKLACNFPMGPLELADFVGLDTTLAVLETMYKGFGDPKYRPCPLLRNMVEAGFYGRKCGRGFYVYD